MRRDCAAAALLPHRIRDVARFGAALVVATALLACAPPRHEATTVAPTTPSVPPAALPSPAAAAPIAATPAAPPPAAAPAIVVPEGKLYVCVTDAAGGLQQAPIDFEPRIGALCARHPEMGPCRYERDVCRRGGGRVYAAKGEEITLQTEAEYDRKVLRVRLQSN